MKHKNLFIFGMFAMLTLSSCQFLPNMPVAPNASNNDTSTLVATSTPNNNEYMSYEFYRDNHNYVGTKQEFEIDKQRGTLSNLSYHNITINRYVFFDSPSEWENLNNPNAYQVIKENRMYNNGETIDIFKNKDTNLATFKGAYEDLNSSSNEMPHGRINYNDYRAYKSCSITLFYEAKYFIRDLPFDILEPGIQMNVPLPLYDLTSGRPQFVKNLDEYDRNDVELMVYDKSNPNMNVYYNKSIGSIICGEIGTFSYRFIYKDFIWGQANKVTITDQDMFTIDPNQFPSAIEVRFGTPYDFEVYADIRYKNGEVFTDMGLNEYFDSGRLILRESAMNNEPILQFDSYHINAQKEGSTKVEIYDTYFERVLASIYVNVTAEPELILGEENLGPYIEGTTIPYKITAHGQDITDQITLINFRGNPTCNIDYVNHTITFNGGGFITFTFNYGNQSYEKQIYVDYDKRYFACTINDFFDESKTPRDGKHLYAVKCNVASILDDSGKISVIGDKHQHFIIDKLTANAFAFGYGNGKYIFDYNTNDFSTNPFTKNLTENQTIEVLLLHDLRGSGEVYGLLRSINGDWICNAREDDSSFQAYSTLNNGDGGNIFMGEILIKSKTEYEGVYICTINGVDYGVTISLDSNIFFLDDKTHHYKANLDISNPDNTLVVGKIYKMALLYAKPYFLNDCTCMLGGYVMKDKIYIAHKLNDIFIKVGEEIDLPITFFGESNASIFDTSIATYNPLTNKIKGIKAGTTTLSFGDVSFQDQPVNIYVDDTYRSMNNKYVDFDYLYNYGDNITQKCNQTYTLNVQIRNFLASDGTTIPNIDYQGGMEVIDPKEPDNLLKLMTVKTLAVNNILFDKESQRFVYEQNSYDSITLKGLSNLKKGDILTINGFIDSDNKFVANCICVNGDYLGPYIGLDKTDAYFDFRKADVELHNNFDQLFTSVTFGGENNDLFTINPHKTGISDIRYFFDKNYGKSLRCYKNTTLTIVSHDIAHPIEKIIISYVEADVNSISSDSIINKDEVHKLITFTLNQISTEFTISFLNRVILAGIEVSYTK